MSLKSRFQRAVAFLATALLLFSLCFVHQSVTADVGKYGDPDTKKVPADTIKNFLTPVALYKIEHGIGGYGKKIEVDEKTGKETLYYVFPLNRELSALHNGLPIYGSPEDIKANFDYSERPGFKEDPNGAYWAVKQGDIYVPAKPNTPDAVRGWFRYAGVSDFGLPLTEIRFPPDVSYRAVTNKVKILRDPWNDSIARDISEVARAYYEGNKPNNLDQMFETWLRDYMYTDMKGQTLRDALLQAGLNPDNYGELKHYVMPVTNQSGEAAAVVLILQYPDRQIVYRTYERVERNNPYNFTLTTIPGSGVPVSSKISYKAKIKFDRNVIYTKYHPTVSREAIDSKRHSYVKIDVRIWDIGYYRKVPIYEKKTEYDDEDNPYTAVVLKGYNLEFVPATEVRYKDPYARVVRYRNAGIRYEYPYKIENLQVGSNSISYTVYFMFEKAGRSNPNEESYITAINYNSSTDSKIFFPFEVKIDNQSFEVNTLVKDNVPINTFTATLVDPPGPDRTKIYRVLHLREKRTENCVLTTNGQLSFTAQVSYLNATPQIGIFRTSDASLTWSIERNIYPQ
ncbi:hypothetical protein B0S90_2805 [Caldicellulosiruptor bescii]|uniref:Uncharacterized protein n=2 Tax=Caldicellulosiruptor bescii TaxID=31899 RepID=B9MNK0_CALBD|nr:hypothetical protein [Caldicellulosiruptor bescii]ACM61531.1 conserved hypothetical protein [Caldicellulosiruptor bescii DSM 6725]PBC88657.1 hypothetical protein B0S87_1686 [Caldicellulosiruptor bescii]PBC91862.1 hypothetical protein B0S89_2307 [Caldicellulosiruptor bescii]PBD02727.1 hypothetical protein B0S85_0267 [Caldicellulosiruptor bescii]PBD07656.1 hypothetical protein B0S90_2805 [Caldicellulosiruptor bescii]